MPSLWCLRELRCPKFLRREPTRTDQCGVILMPHKHNCYVFLLPGMWYFRMPACIKHFSDLSTASISAGPPSVAFFFEKCYSVVQDAHRSHSSTAGLSWSWRSCLTATLPARQWVTNGDLSGFHTFFHRWIELDLIDRGSSKWVLSVCPHFLSTSFTRWQMTL